MIELGFFILLVVIAVSILMLVSAVAWNIWKENK